MTLPYSMLVTAPSKQYLSSSLYMFIIWILLKVSKLDTSPNESLYTGLISGIISTKIAMFVFYLKTKQIR